MVNVGARFTHVSPDPQSRYMVNDDDREEFMERYCEYVHSGGRICLQEMPDSNGPWLIDFDVKSQSKKRRYTKEDVLVMVSIIVKMLKKRLNRNTMKKVRIVVLEKSAPRFERDRKGSEYYKDGFHIHVAIRGGSLDRRSRVYLSNVFTAKIAENDDLQGMWEKLKTTADRVIDVHMESKAWHMYGSAKKRGLEPYLATMFFNETGEEVSYEDAFGDDVENLPKHLSIHGMNDDRVTMRSKWVEEMDRKIPERRKTLKPTNRDEAEIHTDIKFIKEGGFMDMLSDERADVRDRWIEIGWMLYNISQGHEHGLELWREFSQRSDKFVDGECEYEWDRMTVRNMTLGSLLYCAKEDSPEKYEKWKNHSIDGLVLQCLSTSKPDAYFIACILHKMYKEKFVYADAKKDIWYSFHHHRWHKVAAAMELETALNVDIYNKFRDKQLRCNKAFVKDDDEKGDKKNAKVLRDKCEKIMTDLHNPRAASLIIKQAKTLFYDPEFSKKLDMNAKVFAVRNGVLDLETMSFRAGRPDDYCSLVAGCEYNENLSWESDHVKYVLAFFEKVHIDPELREFFYQTIACSLEAFNRNKIAVVHNGDSGGNAKTTVMKWISETLGTYAKSMDASVLCRPRGMRDAGGPQPHLVRLRGARFVQIPELGKDEPINLGVFKVLTSVDPQWLRNGQEFEGEETSTTYTLHIQLNELPPIPKSDQAMWNRLLVLVYESMFVLDADLDKYPVPKSVKKQFEMKRFHADPHIETKLNEMNPALLWILFEKYKKYKKEGFQIPEKVRVATNKYRAENDMFQQYIDDRVERAEDTAFLPCTETFKDFKLWKEENCLGNREQIKSIVLTKELSAKRWLGQTSKKGRTQGWYGFKLKEDEEEEDNKAEC